VSPGRADHDDTRAFVTRRQPRCAILGGMTDASDAFPAPAPDARPNGSLCPGCRRARTADDAAGVAWSSRHTADGVEFVCPACTRADIVLIEAGLPAADRRSSAA
jgi:hypothetical protein